MAALGLTAKTGARVWEGERIDGARTFSEDGLIRSGQGGRKKNAVSASEVKMDRLTVKGRKDDGVRRSSHFGSEDGLVGYRRPTGRSTLLAMPTSHGVE